MNITMTDAAKERLATLLEEEGKDAVVRIREAKVGPPWKSQLVLRLSIDEREADDVDGEAGSLPFVITEDLADQYGTNFDVTLDENNVPSVNVAP